MSESQQKSGGVSFCGLLTVAFIVLKLTGFIAWSWWWVLSPLWIPLAFVAFLFVCAFAAASVALLAGRK